MIFEKRSTRKKTDSKHVIVVKIWEGLGNQLFQYAFARALSQKGKYVLLDRNEKQMGFKHFGRLNAKRTYELDKLKIKLPIAEQEILEKIPFANQRFNENKFIQWLSEYGIWGWKIIEEPEAFLYKENYMKLSGNCYIKGWFQNPKYFLAVRKELLKEIRPKDKIIVSYQLKKLLNMEHITAVHVRRGDYTYNHNCLPISYYVSALDYMNHVLENPVYLFFSDDMRWVKENLGKYSKDNFYYIDELGEYESYEEMFIMSRCKNIIIANSTFSWWSAWLNENYRKIVIAPKSWGRIGGINAADHILPTDWIRI